MSRNITGEPLIVRILRIGQKFNLEIENTSQSTLTDIELLPIFVSGYEAVNERIMVKFDRVPTLPPGEKSVVRHQTYFLKRHPNDAKDLWEEADPFYDFIMVLTEKLSRGNPYTLTFSFLADGAACHQDVPAGAGSGMQDIREMVIEKGQRIYDERLRDQLERGHTGRYVAIEPYTGEYFLGDTGAEALGSAHDALPNSRFYLVRVGSKAAHTIGGHALRSR